MPDVLPLRTTVTVSEPALSLTLYCAALKPTLGPADEVDAADDAPDVPLDDSLSVMISVAIDGVPSEMPFVTFERVIVAVSFPSPVASSVI